MDEYVLNVPYQQNGQTLYYSGIKSGIPATATGTGTPQKTPATASNPPIPMPPATGTPTGTQTGTPAPKITPPNPVGLDDMSFLGLVNTMNNSFQQVNPLIEQKNAVLDAAFGTLSPERLAKLPADVQDVIKGGNREQLMLQAQILTDAINGNNKSVAASIQFLTQGYEQAQKRKDTETANLLNYARYYNTKPSQLVKALYPGLLQGMGADQIAALDALVPLQPTSWTSPTSVGGGTYSITMNPGTIGNSTNNLLGIKYSSDTASLGATESGIQATDGGSFASFSSPQASLEAGVQMLKTFPIYQNATVDKALKTWSNNAYGAEITSLPANAKISSLDDAQLTQLVQDIANNGEKIGTVKMTQPTFDMRTLLADIRSPQANTKNFGFAAGSDLTPNGMFQDGVTFGLTEKIPSVGLGSQPKPTAIRTGIQNIAGAIAGETNYSLAEVQKDWRNLSAAQMNATKQYVLATVNSITAEGYFKKIKDLISKVDENTFQTSVPLLNNWIRTGQIQLTGNADVNNFMSALTEGMTEYAKVVSGQTSQAGVTNFANTQTQKLLDSGFNYNTIDSFATNVASEMMKIRLGAYKEGIPADVPDSVVQFLSVAKGGVSGGETTTPQTGETQGTTAAPDFSKMSTADLQAWIQQNQ